MNVDDVANTVLSEAAKQIVIQTSGAVTGRLMTLFRRKHGEAGLDAAEVERQLFVMAERDPAWAAEIAGVLGENVAAGPVSWPMPPSPFRDRDGVLDKVPESGVFVIAGRRGSGRTALAQQIAWERRARYPGGALLVDTGPFRGDNGELAISRVQRHILTYCGIGAGDQAEQPADLAAQFSSAMAIRRILLILRGVRTAGEIRPFEPGTPMNLVLAITGNLGEDLRAGYGFLLLGGLDRPGAWRLLADRCGEDMLAAEPEWASRLLDLCDDLPEPILFAGGALTRRTDTPGAVEALVGRLTSAGLATEFDAVECSLADTIGSLTPASAEAGALLAHHPGFDFDPASAVALLGDDTAATRKLLDALDDAGLLVTTTPGRRRLHHAVRDYLRPRAAAPGAAIVSLVNFLRDCAVHADHEDSADRLRAYPPGSGERPDVGMGLVDYLDGQRHVLLDAARVAWKNGLHEQVCQLGGALEVLVNKRGGAEWFVALNDVVLSSAKERLRETGTTGSAGDTEADARRAMVVRAHAMQGRMYSLLGVPERAAAELTAAADHLAALRTPWPGLSSSLAEFTGRFHEISAELRGGDSGGFDAAVGWFSHALAIDRETGDSRAVLIHARMLANVFVAAGKPEQAVPLLDEAAACPVTDARNLARVHMVRAKAALRGGAAEWAASWLREARALLDADRSTHYGWELAELEAELASVTGPVEHARLLWGTLAHQAWRVSHPRTNRYLDWLERLR
ncbi:hypothetical protein ABZ639_03955 [Saccharomonospora sp. NPDC006951]